MPLQTLTITHTDSEWHEAFLQFVPRIFPEISFRRWHEYGGWDERYMAFALADGEQLVANTSLTCMQLLVDGQNVRGWQLGAVSTDPAWRGRGLQRQLLERVFEQLPADDLVFLFANASVLDFYPRFGFRAVRERRFGVTHAAAPDAACLRALDLSSPEDRALLQRVGRSAMPVTDRFGACGYEQIVLWYGCNFYAHGLRYAPDADAIFVVEQTQDTLQVHDVLAAQPIDLASYLPQLITAPIRQLEFGFTPAQLWPDAHDIGEYTESPLFVRGTRQLPHAAFKFPVLAQT